MVPVLYHDWTVTETGLDIPVSSITLEQFQKLSGSKSRNTPPGSPRSESPPTLITPALAFTLAKHEMPRSVSSQSGSESPSKDGQTRLIRSNSLGAIARKKAMTVTSEPANPAAKMKGNGLGTIQAPFATLKDTFEVNMFMLCFVNYVLRVCKSLVLMLCSFVICKFRRCLRILGSTLRSNTPCWMKLRMPISRCIRLS